MCCVGGMVEDTTLNATDHEFEPQHMFFLWDGTFSTGRCGTNGSPFSTDQPVASGTNVPFFCSEFDTNWWGRPTDPGDSS